MLPFLKPKKAGTVMVAKYSNGETKSEGEVGEHNEGLMSAAQDLISAIHAKDAKAVCDALCAAKEMIPESKEDFLSET